MQANAQHRIEEYDIRTQGPGQPAGRLSGGNQQKVVVARELSRPLRLFIASQPTRGVDVGSIEFLHRRIVRERDRGPRCSSCRPSWTRSARWPTGSP